MSPTLSSYLFAPLSMRLSRSSLILATATGLCLSGVAYASTMPMMPSMPSMPSVASTEYTSDTLDGVGDTLVESGTSDIRESFRNTGNVRIDGTMYVYGDFIVVGDVTITGKLKVMGKFQVTGNVSINTGRLYTLGKRKIIGNLDGMNPRFDADFLGIDPYLDATLSHEDVEIVKDLVAKVRVASTVNDRTVAIDAVEPYIQDDRESDMKAFESWKKRLLSRAKDAKNVSVSSGSSTANTLPPVVGLSEAMKVSIAQKVQTMDTAKLERIKEKIGLLVPKMKSRKNVAILNDLRTIIDAELESRESLNVDTILEGSEIPSSTPATGTPVEPTTTTGSTATGSVSTGATNSTGSVSTGSTTSSSGSQTTTGSLQTGTGA